MDHVVEIHLPMGREPADAYFALEEALTTAVASGQLGYVDGNDIGQGEFTIFLMGPDGDALLSAVQPMIPAQLLHPGAHAVIRKEEDDEVAEQRIPLANPGESEGDDAEPWQPLSFGAIQGGHSAEVMTFWETFQHVWQALPTAPPSSARSARLIVIWHVAGEIWDQVQKEIKVKVANRDERILGATVPIPQRRRTVIEAQALIRESLAAVLDMCRAQIARKHLDWDLADIDRTISAIELSQ